MNRPTKNQITIIKSKDPLISLCASGGTGKTETITWFVMNRMEEYKKIALITYTNSAAHTMRVRLKQSRYFNEDAHFTGTIHSFCKGILHRHAQVIGYRKDFRLEPGITDKLIKKLLEDNSRYIRGLNNPSSTIVEINRIFLRSNDLIAKIIKENINEEKVLIKDVRRILLKLIKVKRQLNVMDFDDLPYYFYILLKKNPSIVQSLSREYPLMVVDEFQDTTEIQWKAMKQLIDGGIRFLGAGDPYQTLYRFAGASSARFKHLENLPGCSHYELAQNHRSTNQILSLSNTLRLQIDDDQPTIWSSENGPKPQVIVCHQKGLLIRAILDKIRIHLDGGISLNEMAVAFRFSKDSNSLVKNLQREKVPYKTFSGEKRSTSELADFILSTLKISLGHCESRHWRKILPNLSGVGEKNMNRILYFMKKRDFKYGGIKYLTGKRYKNDIDKLFELFLNIDILKDRPSDVLYSIIGFYRSLKKTSKIDVHDPHLATMLNIARLSKNRDEFVSNYEDPPYEEYHPFNEIRSTGFLTLSTIHKIKGKGFKVVFVLGSYDGQFKGHGIFEKSASITDEIMIMDTAVTRSKRHLYFLFPTIYKDWVEKEHSKNSSIFIRNCPKKLYDVYTVSYIRN